MRALAGYLLYRLNVLNPVCKSSLVSTCIASLETDMSAGMSNVGPPIYLHLAMACPFRSIYNQKTDQCSLNQSIYRSSGVSASTSTGLCSDA